MSKGTVVLIFGNPENMRVRNLSKAPTLPTQVCGELRGGHPFPRTGASPGQISQTYSATDLEISNQDANCTTALASPLATSAITGGHHRCKLPSMSITRAGGLCHDRETKGSHVGRTRPPSKLTFWDLIRKVNAGSSSATLPDFVGYWWGRTLQCDVGCMRPSSGWMTG